MTAKGLSPPGPRSRNNLEEFYSNTSPLQFPVRAVLVPIRTSLREDANDGQGAFGPWPSVLLHDRRGLRQAGEAAGPPGTTVAYSCELHNYRGYDWRDGGFAGRRYECFDVLDVADRDKPARPPALQVRRSRVRANRIIIAGRGS